MSSENGVDILMITYNRPEYTRLSLQRLLETCGETVRVWLWHNGTHEETLEVVNKYSVHPSVHRFHHSVENVRLTEPTNWLFKESKGKYLSKVDDDCLVPHGWIEKLTAVHEANTDLGVIGCWRFQPEDFDPKLANRKIRELNGGSKILLNCWVEGSGYLMKRACIEQAGTLDQGASFPSYCIKLAQAGWTNGWYVPFLYQEHMDDPRAENSLLKSDADIEKYMPLSAQKFGARTLDDWDAQLRRSARTVQLSSPNPKAYSRFRVILRRRFYGTFAKCVGLEVPQW